MKKFFVLVAALAIILFALIEVVMPQILTGVLKDKVSEFTASQEIELNVNSSPYAKIAFGEIDGLHCSSGAGRIGDLDVKSLSLDGEKIRLDVPEILFPDQDLTSREHANKILKSAGKLELKGVVDEDDLKSFLERKVDKLQNLELNITPQEITASANVKIMGRTADVELAGTIIADEGNLYFRMTRLNVRNSLLRHVQLDKFFGDLVITEGVNLPLNLHFDSAELRDGEALVVAVR